MDQGHDRERSAQSCPFRVKQMIGHKDQLLQHPQDKLEDHHRLPQSTNPNRDYQDPPEHNDTNGSTKAPTNGKGQGATKSKKATEPCPRTMANTGPATQPSDSLKNTIICSGCGKKWPLEQKLSIL